MTMTVEIIKKITMPEWGQRYDEIMASGYQAPAYVSPMSKHIDDGDTRLYRLEFDPSPFSLHLWNFLLTEEERLKQSRQTGKKIVGAMKDLGTVPVLAYSFPDVIAMYPDGAWWLPCIMEINTELLAIADKLGYDESFCPVRAMLGAFLSGNHFPIPDVLICNVGATCDDFSAIAQGLNGLGYPIHWWESPHRRPPEKGEEIVILHNGLPAPKIQVEWLKQEFKTIQRVIENVTHHHLTDEELREGIKKANQFRRNLATIRQLVYGGELSPLPALETMILEMIALHFCSDREEAIALTEEAIPFLQERLQNRQSFASQNAARIYWVNPVADLRLMNVFESCNARLAGTDYMFTHTLAEIPEDIPPIDALAQIALSDPMTGTSEDRAKFIVEEMKACRAEGLIISKIPGGSHCSIEAKIIKDYVIKDLKVPVLDIECPPMIEGVESSLRTRIEALVETIIDRRED